MMRPLPLFDDLILENPTTEGIKYAGSKLKLIPSILQLAKRVNATRVLDGFSGTTRVSQALAKCGYKVLSNDVAAWSRIFATCYLLCNKKPEEYRTLIDHLNSVPPLDGWFTEHYGGEANCGRAIQRDSFKKPWQIHNTQKLDGIREEIERLSLAPVDKAVALTSLILALDKVDNTLGHFASYLSKWSPRSYDHLRLRIPDIIVSQLDHQVLQEDIFNLLPKLSIDLAYFDPPYGSNNEKMPPSRVRYAAYYHIWTTICLYDKPELFGRAKRRVDTSDTVASSVFEDFRKDQFGKYIAVQAVDELISKTQARWIILSYSSGGRATADELNAVLQRNGQLLEVLDIDHKKNVMADMKWKNEWLRDAEEPNREFLFLLEKQ